jgi:ubiquinone/menaquinone biosynthesis C-methylase UbiE
MKVLPVLTTRREAQRTYGRLSRFYDVTEGLLEGPAKSLALQLAGAIPGETVLEVGPGTGWALQRLSTAIGQAGVVYGVDIAPGMLAVTRKRLRGRRAVLTLGDAAALPLATGAFDLVFMSFVLELIPTQEIPAVLDEIMRVLKPGGRLVDMSLSRESPNLATRIYEWGHKVLPSLLDCRPIYVRRAVALSSFEIVKTRRITIFGLPAEIVLARKPDSRTA